MRFRNREDAAKLRAVGLDRHRVERSLVFGILRGCMPIAALIAVSCLLSGCATVYYSPNSQNVPLFRAKGEWRAAASLTEEGSFFGGDTRGGDVQGAYAITDRVGVMANVYVAGKTDRETGEGGRGRLFEGGVGYYQPVGKRFVFETYGGAGGGTLTYEGRTEAARASVNARRAFLQPSIGFTSKWFDAALSLRMAALHYFHIPGHLTDGALITAAQAIAENTSSFLMEPALTVRGGWSQIKLQLQVGTSKNLSHPTFPQVGSYGSIGGYVAIGRRAR